MGKKSLNGAEKPLKVVEKKEAIEQKVDEIYNDPKAGVTLVSSDNVIFKVHQYFLEAVR
jgi:hypothetical protein